MRIKRAQANMLLAGRTLRQIEAEERAAKLLDRVSRDLESRGITADLSAMIAVQLCERKRNGDDSLTPDQYEALIDGAALACDVHCDVESDSEASVSQVREVERMMQAFAGELSKLDESLEVLSAYVRRMRKQPKPSVAPVRGDQTLH
ncbi:MAG: hypothetical protein JRJ58_23580 [Deltaproteobacteria bacterium]|nr:hypothetical protein [Deltaproteobacteria bacterium]